MGMRTPVEDNAAEALLERLSGAVDAGSAVRTFGEFAAQSGIPALVYGYAPSAHALDGSWTVPAILTHNVPHDWDANIRRLRSADPYFQACFRPTVAVDWRAIQQADDLSPESRRFLAGVADYRMTQGLTIPMRLAHGRLSFISYLGDSEDRDFGELLGHRRSLLLLLAFSFLGLMQARFLDEMASAAGSPLARRELECLRWSALGKSAGETGTILGISSETVRIHLKRAYGKLNANNRCSATAKAMQMGLISLAP